MGFVEVFLSEDVPSLGYPGDKVRVRAGYARNFLLPRGLAIPATARNERELRHRLGSVLAKRARLRRDAEGLVAQMEAMTLDFTLRGAPGGKTFGSVTARDIEEAFKKTGQLISRRRIRLEEPIRTAGTFAVPVRLHPEVVAKVNVKVVIEAPVVAASEAADADGAAPKKRRGGRRRTPAVDAPADAAPATEWGESTEEA